MFSFWLLLAVSLRVFDWNALSHDETITFPLRTSSTTLLSRYKETRIKRPGNHRPNKFQERYRSSSQRRQQRFDNDVGPFEFRFSTVMVIKTHLLYVLKTSYTVPNIGCSTFAEASENDVLLYFYWRRAKMANREQLVKKRQGRRRKNT